MSSEGLELTVVQYARLHGLSVNHLAEPPPSSQIKELQEHIPKSLTDDIALPQIDLPPYVNTQETLALDKRGAELLRAANNGLTTPEELEDIILLLLDKRQTKKLRLEMPLLRTDHDSDIRSFAAWDNSHLKDGCLPWEPLDDEMDVGLEWPKRLKDLPAKVMEELGSEKTEIQKDILIYLQATIKGCLNAEDERQVWDSATSYKRNTALEPVTPPLLPLSPVSMPYIPSSPGCHLPLLSDPASLIGEDLENAEQAIFEQDSLINPAQRRSHSRNSSSNLSGDLHTETSDIFPPIDFLGEEEEFTLVPHIKAEDRRVEVPLMPAMPTPGLPKTVTFNEIGDEMLLDGLSMADHSESSLLGSEENDVFFLEAFGDAAVNVLRNIEQEQLQQADANDRVQVPIMDFQLPDPPWMFIQRKEGSDRLMGDQKAMVADIQTQCGRSSLYSGMSKLNAKLRWSVFPTALAKAVLDENFCDDALLRDILDQGANQQVVDSDNLTWKPPGLRILRENVEDDEDDLGPGAFETGKSQDITSLVRKRKLQYEEESSNLNSLEDIMPKNGCAGTLLTETTTGYQMNYDLRQCRKTDNEAGSSLPKDMNLLLDGPFSASNALENFLEIRAAKKQKPTQSVYFAGPSTEGQSSKPLSLSDLGQSILPIQLHRTQKPLPVPSTNPPPISTPYIVSSAIIKRRSLLRTINALFPTAVPIERDFTAHNRTTWLPNSVTRSPAMSSLDSEADFIISPSTGIILATLQKIKQKPLPGQKAKSAFKDRIEKVTARYERLIILVSEACAEESTNGLAESDTLALAEATGFCSSLEGSVTVQFVGGGEETLAKWLVATIVQYGNHSESSAALLEDETHWELFLRRAGMNAYAAQAVIAELKAPEGVDVEGGSKAGLFGITAFVEMGPEERIARFEQLLGGRRILQRLGRVLDLNWS